jgi:hypothetical protein
MCGGMLAQASATISSMDNLLMGQNRDPDTYSEEETQRRFGALVKAALNTPPKPMKDRTTKRRESKHPLTIQRTRSTKKDGDREKVGRRPSEVKR